MDLESDPDPQHCVQVYCNLSEVLLWGVVWFVGVTPHLEYVGHLCCTYPHLCCSVKSWALKSIKGDHENYLFSKRDACFFNRRSLCAGMLTEAAKVFEKLGDRRRCEEVNTLLKTMNCCWSAHFSRPWITAEKHIKDHELLLISSLFKTMNCCYQLTTQDHGLLLISS